MKKLKLFASLFTMCLCIAVLCVGIYAVQTVTCTIDTTISYTVEEVFANISGKVFKVSGQQTTDELKTYVDTFSATALDDIAESTVISESLDLGVFDTTTKNTASWKAAIEMGEEYKTYYIVINIENLSNRAINAKLTDDTQYTNLDTANKLIQNNIAKGETKNLVVAFSVVDETVGISEFKTSYKVEVGYTEYKTFLDTLQADTTTEGCEYWYVELGTLSDKTTPIRWRVVSLDGTSKYTYTSTKPEIGTSTVFLQETYLGNTVAFDTDANQNYYESDIRTTVNTFATWNIQESDISSLIVKRNITSITYADNASTTAYKGTTSDYFWLLSREEAESTYLTSSTERRWTPNNSTSTVPWWLRSPGYTDTRVVCAVNYDDTIGCSGALYDTEWAIRAAFQLR